MEKESQKNSSLNVSKLSFDALKKADQEKKCHFTDFQPFLEFSSWHSFHAIVERLIHAYRNSLHFLELPIQESHQLFPIESREEEILEILSKAIAESESDTDAKTLLACTKKLEKGRIYLQKLHDLFVLKRKYQPYREGKEASSTSRVCLRPSEEEEKEEVSSS